MGANENCDRLRFKGIPGTIKSLLKRLIEKRVTIVLDAEKKPEHVEIEAVVGNLLITEIKEEKEEERKFKFIDINCICAVIVDRDSLLESIFSAGDSEDDDEGKQDDKHAKNVIHETW
jgi:hypothetical protein